MPARSIPIGSLADVKNPFMFENARGGVGAAENTASNRLSHITELANILSKSRFFQRLREIFKNGED